MARDVMACAVVAAGSLLVSYVSNAVP